MQNSNYKLTQTEVIIENEKHITFGIEGKNVAIKDISLNREKVEKILTLINDARLEECHFEEYIYDELI